MELMTLVSDDNVEQVSQLIDQTGVHFDDPHPRSGRYLIHHAAEVNALRCLRFLIEKGADVNRQVSRIDRVTKRPLLGQTPLMFAKSAEAVQILFDAGADINAVDGYGASALEYAYFRNKSEVIRKLLQLGARPLETVAWGNKRIPVSVAGSKQRDLWAELPDNAPEKAELIAKLEETEKALGKRQ